MLVGRATLRLAVVGLRVGGYGLKRSVGGNAGREEGAGEGHV